MRSTVLVLMLAVAIGAGCVSEKKAKLESQRAYIAGQEQALQAAQRAQQHSGPAVYVQGPVRNPVVGWKEGMMLSQAIVAADYTAYMNPRLIRIIRDGQIVGELKGIDLLHHEDLELKEGDNIVIMQ